MQIITINLSEQVLDAIQTLTDLGIYPSRSEVIRVALEDFLKRELHFQSDLNTEKFELLMSQNELRDEVYFQ